jgi:uncharacterized protein YlxP (DUF503 family)
MVVGICRVELALDGVMSLKGKRSVVKRVIHRIRNRFNCAMAEVDELDQLTVAVLGFTVVANDQRFINSCVDKIIDAIEGLGLAPIRDHQFVIETY